MLFFRLNFKYILDRIKKTSFIKNVLVVMTGSAVAQIIGFALSPVISRLFSPSDFGIFGSFNAVSTIIAAMITLDYTQAIMLPKEKEDALNLFFVSCLCTVAIGFLLFTFCLFAPALLLGLIGAPSAWILAMLVVYVFVNGFNSTCQAWCVRVKAFKHTSASQVIRTLSSNGTWIGLGFLKWGAMGLICGRILADIIASLNLVLVLLSDLKIFRRDIRWDRMKQLVKDYRDFPIYSASKNVLNALSQGLAVLLLTQFYGIAVAGAYAFGERIIYTPMGFVIGALRQVLFQKAAETQHQGGSLTSLYVKTTVGLFALVFFPSLVLFVWAPQIFTFIFGSQWYTAGVYARSIVLWMIFASCNLPAVLFARIIRIQRTIFFYEMVLLAMRALVLVLGGLYLTAPNAIMLFCLVGAAMNLFLILLVGHAVMEKEGRFNLGRL